ncbi:MAG: glutamate cyclase domain-containing protein [Salinarimonas sp.]
MPETLRGAGAPRAPAANVITPTHGQLGNTAGPQASLVQPQLSPFANAAAQFALGDQPQGPSTQRQAETQNPGLIPDGLGPQVATGINEGRRAAPDTTGAGLGAAAQEQLNSGRSGQGPAQGREGFGLADMEGAPQDPVHGPDAFEARAAAGEARRAASDAAFQQRSEAGQEANARRSAEVAARLDQINGSAPQGVPDFVEARRIVDALPQTLGPEGFAEYEKIMSDPIRRSALEEQAHNPRFLGFVQSIIAGNIDPQVATNRLRNDDPDTVGAPPITGLSRGRDWDVPDVERLLRPNEQDAFRRYAEAFPDVAQIVFEAGYDASAADMRDAIRALLNGAYGQDVAAWLRSGGAAGGRSGPPGGNTPYAGTGATFPDPERQPEVGQAGAAGGASGGASAAGALATGTESNAATLENIQSADPQEIIAWLKTLSADELLELPASLHDAIQANFAARFNALVEQNMGRDPIANAPEFERITRELLNYTSLMTEAESIAERLPEGRTFTAAMLDSGNGAYAAASVAIPMLEQMTGGRVSLLVIGDHGNQPYGNKTEAEITMLVSNMINAAGTMQPDVIAMACNTACIAIFRSEEQGIDLSPDIPLVNLIDNTSRTVANNPDVFGARPMILSTQATKDSGLYQNLIPRYSDGEAMPFNVGGSDAPVTNADGSQEIRDLATLVNQMAHRDPARYDEVMNAARHYTRQMDPNMTSLVMCCTHYPELIPFFREALDERGLQHVPIIDPMGHQVLTAVGEMASGTNDANPGRLPRHHGVVSSVGPSSPDALCDAKRSVEGLINRDLPIFTGQNFSGDYDPTMVERMLRGEISTTDLATQSMQGRGVHRFAMPDGAARVAEQIALRPDEPILLTTGFNVPPLPGLEDSPVLPETDGPPGTAVLARTLLGLDREVHIVTDAANRRVLEASLEALGVDLADPNLNLYTFELKGDEARAEAQRMLEAINPGIVGAIELPGRNAQDGFTNMGGIDISGFNPELDHFLLLTNEGLGGNRNPVTIGVGDGGNEAGMGAVVEGVELSLPYPSVVPSDFAVTASDSNIGALAIAAEAAMLEGRPDLLIRPEDYAAAVRAAVDAGAVDGVTRQQHYSVDGFDLQYHEQVIRDLNGAVQGTWPEWPEMRQAE